MGRHKVSPYESGGRHEVGPYEPFGDGVVRLSTTQDCRAIEGLARAGNALASGARLRRIRLRGARQHRGRAARDAGILRTAGVGFLMLEAAKKQLGEEIERLNHELNVTLPETFKKA